MEEKTESVASYAVGGTGVTIGTTMTVADITNWANLVLVLASLGLVVFRFYVDWRKLKSDKKGGE
jgi:hypothetical protein